MNAVLKVIRLFALVVWVGGLLFFAFVVAPVSFGSLPSSHEAGLVVGASLRVLHLIGLSAGIVYLLAAAAGARQGRGWIAPGLIVLMLGLTSLSQWGILPRMEVDRAAAGGDISSLDGNAPARLDFDRLHRLSERIEGGVLLLGLAATVMFGVEKGPRGSDERV